MILFSAILAFCIDQIDSMPEKVGNTRDLGLVQEAFDGDEELAAWIEVTRMFTSLLGPKLFLLTL